MKKKGFVFLILAALITFMANCRKADVFSEENLDERLSGGLNTVFDFTSKAFGNPSPGLSTRDQQVHDQGDRAFNFVFVRAPAAIHSGLGPLYNNVSCISCHHNDGIGLPTAGDLQSSLLLRISLPGKDAHGGPIPVPDYGLQLQDKALFGKQPECKVNINYTNKTCSFDDGETYEMRTPAYTLSNLYTPIQGNYMLSPRLAPPMYGLGLLEAIPESQIVAHADPDDKNGDGISGKPNYVWDDISQSKQLGRFGWKANTASILAQTAAAFSQDIGISNTYFQVESSFGQPQYDNLQDDAELADSTLNAVKFYVQTLAVPARRDVSDAVVKKGALLFNQAKCNTCHQPTFTTKVNVTLPVLSNQVIHPYTDMLLHDMGPGLADNRPDFEADGQEWRTAPLWGIGLYETVNKPGYYLHDGRARTLTEAIMWHGGEAETSKNYFSKLSKTDRDAVLRFLKSL